MGEVPSATIAATPKTQLQPPFGPPRRFPVPATALCSITGHWLQTGRPHQADMFRLLVPSFSHLVRPAGIPELDIPGIQGMLPKFWKKIGISRQDLTHRKQRPQANSQEQRELTQIQPLCPVRPVKKSKWKLL